MIYLDNNATTRPHPSVVEAMLPLYTELWGNPGSGHQLGQPVRRQVAESRRLIAESLGVTASELVFTASGTEAANLAIRGVVLSQMAPRHVITTAVEHPAVLATCRDLEAQGVCELTILGVDGAGSIDLDELRSALRPGETCLVSMMWANNETGVVFPVDQVGRLAHEAGARLHVDGVQAVGKIEFDLADLCIDLLSFSAHKIHGPKGIGGLVVRKGVKLAPHTSGGGQEGGRRSGTENPPAIIGFAAAMRVIMAGQAAAIEHMRGLRDRLAAGLVEAVEGLEISAGGASRLCNTVHLTVRDAESELLLFLLDREGVACAAGSACSTGALEPSHVLVAMGVEASRLSGALRLSLSRETTEAEIEAVVELLPQIVQRARSL